MTRQRWTIFRHLCAFLMLLLGGLASAYPRQAGASPPHSRALTEDGSTCEIMDQYQIEEDYGFLFDSYGDAWQEFRPTLPYVTSVEVLLCKVGAPGNVIVELRTTDETLLARREIAQADVPSWDWTRVEFGGPVKVTPGDKCRIYVSGDREAAPEDRYTWRGKQESTYECADCYTDVSTGWPTYDYAFKTYGVPTVIYLPAVLNNSG